MSEMAARSCNSKKRHRSERRAKAAAKVTQKLAGVRIKHYPCPYCKGFHVGSVKPQSESYMRTSRDQRKQVYTNFNRDRTEKTSFGRKPYVSSK